MEQLTGNKYVLVLPSWYPSRVDKFNGDFNERFVQAVSAEIKQVVLYVVKDLNSSKVSIEIVEAPNVITYRVYYPGLRLPVIGKLYSVWQYLRLNSRFINKIITLNGTPFLIQCYVFYPAVLAAIISTKRYNFPIVITENWTAFYKTNPKSLYTTNFLKRTLHRYMINCATHIIPVVSKLGTEIKKWCAQIPQTIIPNVVDTNYFNNYEVCKNAERFVFLHVSSMKYQKNIDGLLRSFEQAVKAGINAELTLVGPITLAINSQIENSTVLKNNVHALGELGYIEVAKAMKRSNCLIMFSRYENLPCVILEALCCGLPVISTDVGGISEVLNQSNGILINSENELACVQAMLRIVEIYPQFDCSSISSKAIDMFCYSTVSKSIKKVYDTCSDQIKR